MNPPPETVATLKERLDKHEERFEHHLTDYSDFKLDLSPKLALLLARVDGISGVLKWIGAGIGAAILTALMNLILKGGT